MLLQVWQECWTVSYQLNTFLPSIHLGFNRNIYATESCYSQFQIVKWFAFVRVIIEKETKSLFNMLLLWLKLKKKVLWKTILTAVYNWNWSVWLKLWLSLRFNEKQIRVFGYYVFYIAVNLWNYFKWHIYTHTHIQIYLSICIIFKYGRFNNHNNIM